MLKISTSEGTGPEFDLLHPCNSTTYKAKFHSSISCTYLPEYPGDFLEFRIPRCTRCDARCYIVDQKVNLVRVGMKFLNVRNQFCQTIREVWEDGSTSNRSGRRTLSIVKRINCSMPQFVVAYCSSQTLVIPK